MNIKCLRELSEYLRVTGKQVTKTDLKAHVMSRDYSESDFDDAYSLALNHSLIQVKDDQISTTFKLLNECRGLK